MKKGLIIRSIGEIYTVIDVDSNEKIEVKPRGNIRYKSQKPKVGDYVEYDVTIDKILDRKNDLVRPPICNIDQAVLVFSCIKPDISFSLLDRFISLIEDHLVTPVIVITKIDLHNNLDEVKQVMNYYEKLYDVYYINNETGEGTEDLKTIFKDKVTVFTGQTGVGKSSLLNSIGGMELKTDEISKALGRGKHTTRHTELYDLFGGLIADTPGFSSLELLDMSKEDLRDSFVDFVQIADDCKYRGCFHNNEPLKDCAVKRKVENNEILKTRYKSYLSFLNEIEQKKVKY